MKQTIFFACGAAALLLAGCAKTPEEKAPQGRVVTISASIDVDDETKATVGDDGSFKWASGDQIGVWTSNDGGTSGKFTRFDLKGGEAGKATAEFTGTLDDGYEIVAGPVVFPYRAGHSYNPSTQELSYNQAAMTMESAVTKSHMAAMYSGSGAVSLKHLSGLIRFVVFNVPASTGAGGYIRLRTTDKKLTGDFIVDMSASTPQIVAPDATGNQDFNLNFSSAPEDAVGKMYVANFPVPVGTYSYLRLSVQRSGGDMIGSKEKTSPTTVARGAMINMPEVTINSVELANNEDGLVRDNFNKVDYTTAYTGSITTDASLEVVSNPVRTVMNASSKVLKVTSTADGGYSGLIDILTKGAFTSDPVAYYPSGYRDGTKAFTVKMLYADPSDATKYYPKGQCKSTQDSMVRPDRVNGEAFDGTAGEWERLIKPGDWNVLQWTCNNSGTYRIDIKPFLNISGENQTSDAPRIIYFDDFRFLK